MIKLASRQEMRRIRHRRLRKKIKGTSERPRLCVFKSLNHIYAQIIDDEKGHTLVSASTLSPELKGKYGHGGNVEAAKLVGQLIARKALEKGIKKVVFDRGGHKYHGAVKALADAARAEGLEF
ncbi:MAG: 50S ribosomal protein L18 [Synergistetes bacterium]|nr:50S ribosomal protein L18 [Synergistota bacterium]MDK2872024.1 large subunit ribosomal protein [bacterium]